jgi:hypothetical protein
VLFAAFPKLLAQRAVAVEQIDGSDVLVTLPRDEWEDVQEAGQS